MKERPDAIAALRAEISAAAVQGAGKLAQMRLKQELQQEAEELKRRGRE